MAEYNDENNTQKNAEDEIKQAIGSAQEAKKVADDVAKTAKKFGKIATKIANVVMFVIAHLMTILKVVGLILAVGLIINIFQYMNELSTAKNTPKRIYETLEVDDIKELIQIVGNDDDGYHLEFVDDIDDKVDKIIDVLGAESGTYTIHTEDSDIIKKMILAEAYTQFPNLAGPYDEANEEFQGAVRVRRVTPDQDIPNSSMKNVGDGVVTTLGNEEEEPVKNISSAPETGTERVDKPAGTETVTTYKTAETGTEGLNNGTGSGTIGDPEKEYILAIAAGHNNTDNTGAQSGEFIEQDMTIEVAEKVEELAAKYSNIKVVQTGSTSENPGGISKYDRVKLAKEANADICIQIHFNATEAHNASGVETWYEYGDGYSEVLAEILSKQMSEKMGLENRGAKAHENNSTYWTIIDSYAQTGFPSVITEGGFLDNANDQKVLRNGGIEKYAQALLDGCIEYLTSDHSDISVNFVGRSEEKSSINSVIYDLKYVSQEKFDKLVEDNSKDALNYYTLDDSFNVITASWSYEGEGLKINTNAPMDFRTTLQNVTMPYEYLLFFLIDSGNKDFVRDLADMVAESEIVMAVQDNVTTTSVSANVEQRKNATIAAYSTDWSKNNERSAEESSFTEYCSTSVSITYADTWFVRYSRENESYSAHSLGVAKDEIIQKKKIKVRGKVNDQTETETKDAYKISERVYDSVEIEVPKTIAINEATQNIVEKQTIEYSYVMEEKYTKSIHTISNTYEDGEPVVEEKINAFINLYNDYKMPNSVKERWLFQILEENEKTVNMVDLTKYLIYKATGNSYGVEEFDFSVYDLNAFSGMGGIYGSTLEEKVWFALRGAGFSEIATAGAMGNIEAESGFTAGAVEGGSGIGIGICQWSFGRRTKLENYAASKGVHWSDENIQIEFLLGELTPGGGANGYAKYALVTYKGYSPSDWKNAQDVETATQAFCWSFERPGIPHMDRRIASAKKYYSQFKGRTAPSGDSRIGAVTLSGDKAQKMMALLQDAVRIADDNRYTYSQPNRYGEFQYDCSSLVARLYKKHFNFTAPSTTRGYGSAYRVGRDGSVQLQPGDVLWRSGHVEMYIGNGQQVGAHGRVNRAAADQISVVNYKPGAYTYVYRFIQ